MNQPPHPEKLARSRIPGPVGPNDETFLKLWTSAASRIRGTYLGRWKSLPYIPDVYIQELLQDTLSDIWKAAKCGRFIALRDVVTKEDITPEVERMFLSFACQTFLNKCRNHCRSRSRHPTPFTDLARPSDRENPSVHPDCVDTQAEADYLTIEREELSRIVIKLIDTLLSGLQHDCFKLHLEDVPLTKIAERLSVSYVTAKDALFRARKRIRTAIERLGYSI